MDRFWETATSFLGLKKRSKKRIDKEQRGIALNLNSAGTNELTIHKTPDEKEGKLKDKGKLFVGGLSYATTSKELSVYFSKFGDVINSVVIKCPTSGKSRGFGFVSFLDPADAEKTLQTKHHVLHGRTIECRPFDSKDDSKEIKPKSSEKTRVFLGGLPAELTKKELEQFFSRYGKVMSVYVPIDRKTKREKGFAFISFENEDDAENCISERFVYLKGRRIFMNKAAPRDAGARAENGISGSHGSTLTDQEDSFTEYTEDSESFPDEDSQSSSSGQLNFELEQHPEFQLLFQNYFAKKLSQYSKMSREENEHGKQQLQSSEIKALENIFRQMSVNSPWDLDQDTNSESTNGDTSDETYEDDCENLVSFLAPQIESVASASKNSVGKSPNKVTLPVEKDGPDLKFSTQEFTQGKLHTPMNFKNNTGTLTCSACQWIPPDQSFETFLAHCRTAAHKIKLMERFPESQTLGVKVEPKVHMNNEKQKDSSSKVNFYPKVTGIHLDDSQRQNNAQNAHECGKTLQYIKLPEQPIPQQLVKQEVQKVEKVKKKKKKKKQKQEQMMLNSAQQSKTDAVPNSENKKQVSQTNKQNAQQDTKDKMINTLNLKIFALSKGMSCIQALSENSLSCETCKKQIPSSSNFDALMRNVLMHIQSKKHLKKLLKAEDNWKSLLSKNLVLGETTSLDIKNSRKDKVEGNKILSKKINSPKDQSLPASKTLVQEKTVIESKKPNQKEAAIKTQNAAPNQEKGKTDNLGVKFLCLQCNFSNSIFEEFGRHLESERHSNSSTSNGTPRAKNPECTECNYCNTFLFGSLFEINVHFTECSKKKG